MGFVVLRGVADYVVPELTNQIGLTGQLARDDQTLGLYINLDAGQGWTQIIDDDGTPLGISGLSEVTVQNAAGTIQRTSLPITAGVVTLAATDTIVASGDSVVLNNSTGTVSSGNDGLNSPATAVVVNGGLASVTASP